MKVWLRARYYCNNTHAGCRYAKGDVPFSAQEFRKFEGRCCGRNGDGCGQALVAGQPLDLRPKWTAFGFAGVVVALGLGWGARTVFFPPPIEGIAFAVTETRVDDGRGLLSLEVVRKAGQEHRVTVGYTSVDGTAKAGQDYEAVQSRVIFESGESHKVVSVTLLPDRTQQKGERHFTLILTNVLGEPKHVVFIAPRHVDRSQQLQAEQAVLLASRIATDIGGFVVKRRVLVELLDGSRTNNAEFRAYKQQLIEVQDNLSRAREGYAQSMRTLLTHQATGVLNAMDRTSEDLRQKTFEQQSQAIKIMKRQFSELLAQKSMDMDRWANELATIVPNLGHADPKSST